MQTWTLFLVLIFASVVMEAFFSMMEMACVSFNKVKLQYFISKGNRRAKWISYLLKNPARLFGTTLIGVNVALQFGSECARRFFMSLDLSPDIAPFAQFFVVIIFAELSPMFAARRYAEHVGMLGIPIIYVFSKLMTPLIWFLNGICFVINKLLRIPTTSGMHLTREELQKAIEAKDEIESKIDSGEFDSVVSSIFSLKSKIAKDLMYPIEKGKLLSSNTSLSDLRTALDFEYFHYLPIFHISKQNIVGIVFPRDLIGIGDEENVKEHARQPWFILEKSSILQTLKQFRRNNQTVAVVLNHSGLATGFLTLDMIIEEIFGSKGYWATSREPFNRKEQIIIEKTFACDTKISEINRNLRIFLPAEGVSTLEELMIAHLGHRPNKGESIKIEQYELTMQKVGVLKGKKISIRTIL